MLDQDLLERIRCDRKSETNPAAQPSEIEAVERSLGIALPQSYRTFLMATDGGEFLFGRMHSVAHPAAHGREFLEMWQQLSEHSPSAAAKHLVPFGDDHGGNYYCFDLELGLQEGECSVVQWNHEEGADQDPRYIARSFQDFIQEAYTEAEELPIEIDVYLASPAELPGPTGEVAAALTVRRLPAHRIYPYVRKKLSGRYVYEVALQGGTWTGSRDIVRDARPSNPEPCRQLSSYLSSLPPLELEIFTTWSGEESTDPRYRIWMGALDAGPGKSHDLFAGDHVRLVPPSGLR